MRALPNFLTLIRLAAGPLGAWALWQGFLQLRGAEAALASGGEAAALEAEILIWAGVSALLLTLGAASDWLDGMLARRLKAVSRFGALMDPIADKVFAGSYLVVYALIAGGDPFLAAPVAAIIMRDVIVTGLRLTAPERGEVALPVTLNAKMKTAAELIVIALPFLAVGLALPFGSDVTGLLVQGYYLWVGGVWFVALLSLTTGWTYLRTALGERG